MCKTLTFLRLCKVLPEDDEKQQSTINGGKVLVNERLCSSLLSVVILAKPFICSATINYSTNEAKVYGF